MEGGIMDRKVIGGLVNSISRLIHLVACQTGKTPVVKDFRNIVDILKLLKPILDEAFGSPIPSDDQLVKAFEELDVSVNEAREFMERLPQRMSKIYSVLQSGPILLKVQRSSIPICQILNNLLQSSSFTTLLSIIQKREKLAKESRAKQKYTHTSGSKSFARKEKEIENTVGRVPGLVEMFELTHTKKNGSFISEEAKKLMADAKEKLASCSGTSESSRECMIAMENKIYIEIIRKEYGGRVGGLGMIPFESCVCYHSESIEEVQKLREEVQENKKMVSQLQSQLAVVMEFIRQKMPDCNLGGSSHDPESSGVRCTSASSNRSTDS